MGSSEYVPIDEFMTDEMVQSVMWAYIDAAQKTGHAHDRLVRASRAATRAVLGRFDEAGYRVVPRASRELPAHGTNGGYGAGCRCVFCTEAITLAARSRLYWKQVQGDNKVRR